MAYCRRCGKPLTDPKQAALGIGPVCAQEEATERATLAEESADRLVGPYCGPGVDVVLVRVPLRNGRGAVQTNVPRVAARHAPEASRSAYEWGYGGSGPAELALNVLAAFVGRERAERGGLYQDFKWRFVATMPEAGGTIPAADVEAWLAANEKPNAA